MGTLDILSESPQLFIFQQEKNKTRVGGIFTILYALIIIFLAVIYILDYNENEKYTYEALTFDNSSGLRDYERMNADEKLNPYLNITLTYEEGDFAIVDVKNKRTPIPKENMTESRGRFFYNFRKKVSDIDLIIYFVCGENSTCEQIKGKSIPGPTIQIEFPYHKMNHYIDPPVDESTSKKMSLGLPTLKEKNIFSTVTYNWEAIKYNDQKSLFDVLTKRKTKYIFGKIKGSEFSSYPIEFLYNDTFFIEPLEGFGYSLRFFELKFTNKHEQYLYYKRTKISFLDLLANVCALATTIKGIFVIAFSFYSKNFDNFQIVERILNQSH